MEIKQIQSEGLKRAFDVTISADEIVQEVDGQLLEIGKTAKIPGFRPGHIPLPILRNRFAGRVLQDAIRELMDAGIKSAFTKNEIQPAHRPKVEAQPYEDGKDLQFKIDVEVMPEITPVEIEPLSFQRLKVEIEDQDIDKALQEIADGHQRMEAVDESHAAVEGDVLDVTMQAWKGEEKFDLHTRDNIQIYLGSKQFDPLFQQKLVGAKAGEDKKFTYTHPEDVRHSQVAGQEISYEISIHGIEQPVKDIKIDDELAQDKGLKDLDALKEKVRSELESHYEQASFWQIKRRILDALAEKHDFPLPSTLVDRELESIKATYKAEKDEAEAREDGATEETKDKSDTVTKDESEEEMTELSQRRVMLGLLLAQIAKNHNIIVSQSELSNLLLEQARKYPGKEAQLVEYYQKHPEAIAMFKASLLENKVVEFILEKAKIEELKVSAEEFAKEYEKIAN